MTISLMKATAAALLLTGSLGATAAVKTIEGRATWYGDRNTSRAECERLAADQARINALAEAYGTTLRQDLLQSERLSGDSESSNFMSLSTAEVKGIWLGDLQEPRYDVQYDADGNLVVSCTVKGKARELTNTAPQFESSVLKGVADKSAASTSFADGNDMFVHFSGAEDGYTAIYLLDESDTVYQLLPYPRAEQQPYEVTKGYDYYFFDTARGDSPLVDPLVLNAPDHEEFNRLFILYSPRFFSLPRVTMTDGGLPTMDYKEFTKWLARVQSRDDRMGLATYNLVITPVSDGFTH